MPKHGIGNSNFGIAFSRAFPAGRKRFEAGQRIVYQASGKYYGNKGVVVATRGFRMRVRWDAGSESSVESYKLAPWRD
jgi:hypothetical protein